MSFIRHISIIVFSLLFSSSFGLSRDSVYVSNNTFIYVAKNTSTNIIEHVSELKVQESKREEKKNLGKNKKVKSQHFPKVDDNHKVKLASTNTSKKPIRKTFLYKSEKESQSLTDFYSKKEVTTVNHSKLKSKFFIKSKNTELLFLYKSSGSEISFYNKHFIEKNKTQTYFSRPPPMCVII